MPDIQSPQPIANLPPEVLRLPRPRPHSPYRLGKTIFIVAIFWTLLWGIAIVSLIGKNVRDMNEYNWLKSDGVAAQATVTGIEEDNSDDSNTYYIISYHFLADGVPVEDRDYISYELYRSLKPGARLDVLYLQSKPQISAVKSELAPPGNTNFLMFFILMAGIAFLIGVGAIWFGATNMKRDADLRKKGKVVWGVVFDKWKEPGSDDDFYYVAYAYKVPENKNQIFSGAILSEKIYKSLNRGDRIAVRYLPENPEFSSPNDHS